MKKDKLKDRLVIPKKKPSKAKLKEKAWKEFSRFIRLRDSDENGIGKCCTCTAELHWKKLQAGHFAQGRRNSILFDEQTTHAQCYGCNICRHGALDDYAVFMIKKYGQGIIEEMNARKNVSVTYYEDDFIAIHEKYKRLADIYERNKK